MRQIDTWIGSRVERLKINRHRDGFYVHGDETWNLQVVQSFLNQYSEPRVAYLGGAFNSGHQAIGYKRGETLLGQELDVLVVDFNPGFDANSFTAALGALVGGGVLIVTSWQIQDKTPDWHWLNDSLLKLTLVRQGDALEFSANVRAPNTIEQLNVKQENDSRFLQQQQVVRDIVRVVEGHRKRPLVITADRGRGKSSSLGIAVAELMQSRILRIAITAPLIKSVTPVFQHAARLLNIETCLKGRLEYQQSSLQFVAPDELAKYAGEFDFVLVDEAAALPLSLLKQFVNLFHRLVFSSTIHGYEGSGRGFTLKFLTWLKQERPQSRQVHLTQPIRWNENDPLERWSFESFLLDAEISPLTSGLVTQKLTLQSHSKSSLVNDKAMLRRVFALLVNAHYQTSPNDLFTLLADGNTDLFTLQSQGLLIGCLLTVREGQLSEDMITDIAQGNRRPQGQLVVSSLINHLGLERAGRLASERVMRIAVHPEVQAQGVGSEMLTQYKNRTQSAFVSTSFGMSSDLVGFWLSNNFVPIKLGSKRDAASGTYSMIMAEGDDGIVASGIRHFKRELPYWLLNHGQYLDTDLIRALLPNIENTIDSDDIRLLENFVCGGSNSETIASLLSCILFTLNSEQKRACSNLLLMYTVCHLSVERCCLRFKLTGRKQFDAQLRLDVGLLVDTL
ncbi:GNAT family N-acetyltransferase [Vibrio sp. FNV 38]|nr:GNAT family N-acetyltransferase [Vibrio sp. FNV 38]